MPHEMELDTEWEHKGLLCGLRKNDGAPKGPYNGYVRVPSDHPFAGKRYGDLLDIDAHGGLTFSYIEKDGATWFGWDDCHSWLCDRPAMAETEYLADQLAKHAPE